MDAVRIDPEVGHEQVAENVVEHDQLAAGGVQPAEQSMLEGARQAANVRADVVNRRHEPSSTAQALQVDRVAEIGQEVKMGDVEPSPEHPAATASAAGGQADRTPGPVDR